MFFVALTFLENCDDTSYMEQMRLFYLFSDSLKITCVRVQSLQKMLSMFAIILTEIILFWSKRKRQISSKHIKLLFINCIILFLCV